MLVRKSHLFSGQDSSLVGHLTVNFYDLLNKVNWTWRGKNKSHLDPKHLFKIGLPELMQDSSECIPVRFYWNVGGQMIVRKMNPTADWVTRFYPTQPIVWVEYTRSDSGRFWFDFWHSDSGRPEFSKEYSDIFFSGDKH